MKILMNSGGIAMTNCYVVADEVAKTAVLFDAPNDTTAPLLDAVEREGWDLIGLWLTHGHFDHIADHARVTERFPNSKVLIHTLDEPKLVRPMSALFQLPFTIAPRRADELIHDGQRLMIGSIPVDVLQTPGHSPGHVMFHLPTEEVLVGGDLIIMHAVGRTDLPDASEAQLNNSIKRIMPLPGPTRLLPGHGEVSTLAEERETNSYVRAVPCWLIDGETWQRNEVPQS